MLTLGLREKYKLTMITTLNALELNWIQSKYEIIDSNNNSDPTISKNFHQISIFLGGKVSDQTISISFETWSIIFSSLAMNVAYYHSVFQNKGDIVQCYVMVRHDIQSCTYDVIHLPVLTFMSQWFFPFCTDLLMYKLCKCRIF